MNQKGYSWPEAVLTITIISVIFGTLLPLATNMMTTLHKKKLAMHAAETAYKGAIAFQAYGNSKGQRKVEGMNYDWQISGNEVCVRYQFDDLEQITKCIVFEA